MTKKKVKSVIIEDSVKRDNIKKTPVEVAEEDKEQVEVFSDPALKAAMDEITEPDSLEQLRMKNDRE